MQRCRAARGYRDYREMLSKEKPDLVSIGPRWTDQRRDMVTAAAEAGAHIMLEKPFAPSLADADAMVEAVEKNRWATRCVLAVGREGNVVFCQLAPWQFDYKSHYHMKQTFRRTSYLLERVLSNMGVSAATPLLERFSKPVANGSEEKRWLNGFYLD
jgi:hypothetical protein